MDSKNKVALITGINGQDGSYLAELLLDKGYEVWGILRRNSVPESQSIRIEHLRKEIILMYGDLMDPSSLTRVINASNPDEIYNLGAQSHVRVSFDIPVLTTNVVAVGMLNLLEAVKESKANPKIYQASSSEMFGNSIDPDGFQRETTPMRPVSPYGCAKVYAYNICNNYKNSYDMFISNGILFNHESPRRGINFVTNKIVSAAIDIANGDTNKLVIGNLEAARDWGHAKDYVKAMWAMMQLDEPDNFVVASGISHTVQDVIDYVFNKLNLDPKKHVTTSKKHFRPEELKILKGDATKFNSVVKWEPEYTFETMLDEMVEVRIRGKERPQWNRPSHSPIMES